MSKEEPKQEFDVYATINAKIIEQLEKGVVPWRRVYAQAQRPKNFETQNFYSGVNRLLLHLTPFSSPYWMTYKQAEKMKGQVRKGEKGTTIVKYGTYAKKTIDPITQKEERIGGQYLKAYSVFNAEQIDGIEFPPIVMPEVKTPEELDYTEAERIVKDMPNPPKIKIGVTSIPFYRKTEDAVHMPNVEAFENKAAYYGTLFHELAHSTGHQIRCNRKSLTENVGRSNLDIYTVEELVAELASSYLNSFAGIQYDLPNSVSYMQDWITTLKKKDSKTMIISAAAQAQKACDYILNTQPIAET